MEIQLITIRKKRLGTDAPEAALIARYMERATRYDACSARELESEASLLGQLDKPARRTAPLLVLADSRGKLLTSEDFAAAFRDARDAGTQQVLVAIGPADGWSEAAIKRAGLVVSFGRVTLPHELAAVVAAEQIYRALTILAGHPYHGGH